MNRETALPRACLCPHCGAQLDASTALDTPDAAPRAGDYSLCLHCGCILIYNADMTMRRAELADLAKLSPKTARILMAAQAAQHQNREQLAALKKPESKN